MRVRATDAAAETIGLVRASGRTDLVMVLSNGCCDATAPYLYDAYVTDPDSREVGAIDGGASSPQRGSRGCTTRTSW